MISLPSYLQILYCTVIKLLACNVQKKLHLWKANYLVSAWILKTGEKSHWAISSLPTFLNRPGVISLVKPIILSPLVSTVIQIFWMKKILLALFYSYVDRGLFPVNLSKCKREPATLHCFPYHQDQSVL